MYKAVKITIMITPLTIVYLNTTDCGMKHPPPVFFSFLLSVYISILRRPTHESCSYLKVIPETHRPHYI